MANNLIQIPADVNIAGTLRATTFILPTAIVLDATVAGAAGIQASKLQHRHQPVYNGGDSITTAVTNRQVLHYVYGTTGTILAFRCGSVVANVGAATVSIQLKKNGANILTAATVLDNANTAFIVENEAGFTSTALVLGDVLEVDITAAAGGGTLGKGVFASLVLNEDAQ